MRFPIFVNAVARRAQLPPERAAAISRAALVTLAERVSAGEADHLAAQLPDDLGGYLAGPTPAEAGAGLGAEVPGGPAADGAAGYGPVEFLHRVAERAGVEPATAEVGVRAVFATLREAVTVGEFQDLVSQLPKSFIRGVDSGPVPPYDR
ncbi:DUF2267 domain-containing protein [Micromonospora sp. CPCC 205711]|uniref:DUF2267 domain-containing protein n=1 Tax=Micromonospora sp. CPCC 205547 TaxID=3122400 RepID=UPI002FF3523A